MIDVTISIMLQENTIKACIDSALNRHIKLNKY